MLLEVVRKWKRKPSKARELFGQFPHSDKAARMRDPAVKMVPGLSVRMLEGPTVGTEPPPIWHLISGVKR